MKLPGLLTLFWLSFVVSLAGICLVYKLHRIPFGPIFNTSLIVAVSGVVLTLFFAGLRIVTTRTDWKKFYGVLLLLAPIPLLLLVTVAGTDHRALHFRSLPPRPTVEQWREDLRYLADTMIHDHPHLFAKFSEEEFHKAVASLDNRMDVLTNSQIMAGFFEIAALPQDGHTYAHVSSPSFKLHVFPIQAYWFGDSLFVVKAGREHKTTIGSRIVKIGQTDIGVIRERCRRYVSADSKYGALERLPTTMMIGELLEAEGIIASRRRAIFTLENHAGERYQLTIRSVSNLLWHYWNETRTVANTVSPVIANRRKNYYWFEYREESKTVYFGFNQVSLHLGKESLRRFTARMQEFIDTHDFDRFVVDLRNNRGGNGRRVAKLVDFVKKSNRINEKGKLFVLMGRKTYSAAVMYASMLANNAKAVFVGEPTGQGPFFYSVANRVVLPNSKLEFEVSSMSTEASLAGDDRPWLEPDVYVDYTVDDFIEGRDPVMDAVFHYEPETFETVPLREELLDLYTGRYTLGPCQILIIKRKGAGLRFAIDDFIIASTMKISSDLRAVAESRFRTDIKGVELEFPLAPDGPVEEFQLKWKGMTKTVRRPPEGYKTPMELVAEGQVDQGVKTLLGNKRVYLNYFGNLELSINDLGFEYLRNGQYEDAIKILALNVEFYPRSSNVYDSLGEAYLESGNIELAVVNYTRCLELDPDNEDAARVLKQLRKRVKE